ncbi:MAG: tetratricopeptide repeat protein [Xenococcaceae cyanobacterium MO_234.B1]|nr:tetratricopeptide repeat protein [Xenococcaceae cyanobacterium MO_234.B1]
MVQKQKRTRSLAFVVGVSSFLMLSTPSIPVTIFAPRVLAQESVNQQLQREQLEQLARSITVKIISEENGGSGVLIKKEGQSYTVLTNDHVIEGAKNNRVQTNDGKIYQAQRVSINFGDKDLALLQFRSNLNYRIAPLSNLSNLERGDEVFVAGFPFRDKNSLSREFVFRSGRLSFVLSQALQRGYRIGYVSEESEIEKGMSGGPILDREGKLIGVNGLHANPLWGNPYIYEDGNSPNEELRNQMSRSNWGIPTEVLAKLAPNIVTEITPLKEPESRLTNSSTPELVSKIDKIAKEISVLITWQTQEGLGNGSGVIIAQEGNTHYVLTAGHVVVKNQEKVLSMVTHDGQEYPAKLIKKFEGVDLALLQFTSNKSYQVATLGNYYRGLEDRVVFVYGWPGSRQPTVDNLESSHEFNAGYLLGYNAVNQARDNRSFIEGWGLVYSNFAERGMSGGPALDTEGRLIGIHTAAESDKGKESPVLHSNQEPILDIGYSLGVPIRSFLAKLEQEQIKLNLNEKTSAPRRLSAVQQDAIVKALINLKQPGSNANEIEWLNYGNKLWRLRHYEESLRAFEKAIAIKPDFYKAWYSHGWALMRQKNYSEAKKSFRKAIKSTPESQPFEASLSWRQLSDAYYYSGEYDEALQALEQAIDNFPGDFILYQWKLEILYQLGRYQEALAAVNTSLEYNPNSPMGYSRRANILLALQDNEGAISAINKALNLQPGNAVLYKARGGYRVHQEDYEAAIADFNKAIEIEPEFAQAYAERGFVYAKKGNRQGFTSDSSEALRLQPENGWLYTIRGNSYFALGEKEKGIRDYDTAISLQPESAHQYYNWRGNEFKNQEDYEAAIADYTKAISLQPNLAVYYSNRGRAYSKQEKYDAALTDYNKAIEIQPNLAVYYSNRGNAYISLKQYDAASADFNQYLELVKPGESYGSDIAWNYAFRGWAYWQLGEYEKAVSDYNKAIEGVPPNERNSIYKARALVRAEAGDVQGAREDWEKVAQFALEQDDMDSYKEAQENIRRLQQ